jgi:hypothetical protein
MREDELPDIRPLRPGSFVARTPLWSGPDLLAFDAREPGDFDWIEEMMLTHGCYEHEGVWDLALGFDKQAMAEIMAAFRPARTLEIGCASGTVLHYLAGLGLPCEGDRDQPFGRRAGDPGRARLDPPGRPLTGPSTSSTGSTCSSI